MTRILLVATFILSLQMAALCQARPDHTVKARLLADEYIGISSNSEVKNKAQAMTDFRAAPRSFSSIDLDDFNLRADGDSYVISGRARVKVRWEDHDLNQQFRYAKAYVRRRGRWQVIALHMIGVVK